MNEGGIHDFPFETPMKKIEFYKVEKIPFKNIKEEEQHYLYIKERF